MSINKVRLLAVAFALLTTSCSREWFTTYAGNMPSEDRIAKVSTGQYKEEVFNNLGAPSNIVSLDRNTWMYMSSEIEQVAFFKPEEISRDVLIIRFNDENKVEAVKRLAIKDGQTIEVSQDSTRTLGQEPGFFERFFGGVGTYMPFAGRRQQM